MQIDLKQISVRPVSESEALRYRELMQKQIATRLPDYRMLGTARLTGQVSGAVMVALIFTVNRSHPGGGPVMNLSVPAQARPIRTRDL